MDVADLLTPCLLLDEPRMMRNIQRMQRRMAQRAVPLRPHLKTAKCAEVARRIHGGNGPITVSTLAEARYFADAGFHDILYAVGIAPQRVAQAVALSAQGCHLILTLDNEAACAALEASSPQAPLPVMIEIDCDGERAGLEPADPRVVSLARRLESGRTTRFAGYMTHGGGAYRCRTAEAIARHAEQERRAVVEAAERARAAGLAVPAVSAGSTPTATFARRLDGVTEMRPGVFVFQDLYQAGLGVCTVNDLALSVLTTVIGHKPDHNRLLVDAGSLALSRDHSTADQRVDCGYGLVCTADGALEADLYVAATNQEHGMITTRSGGPLDFDRFGLGRHLRILPNHACMTAAAYDRYHVLDAAGRVTDQWHRCNGW